MESVWARAQEARGMGTGWLWWPSHSLAPLCLRDGGAVCLRVIPPGPVPVCHTRPAQPFVLVQDTGHRRLPPVSAPSPPSWQGHSAQENKPLPSTPTTHLRPEFC